MAEFYTDRRDVEFTLFEQNDVEKLRSLPAFSEITLEDMKMILEQAEELAKNVIYPLDEVADTVGAQYREGKVVMPEEFHGAYKTLREGGWLSMAHSPEWGGQGLPYSLSMGAYDFLMGACPAFCLTVMLSASTSHLIETFGTEELKKLYCEKLFSGEWTGTMCLTEPQAGSDVGASTTKAVKEGDHYRIEGNKIFITGGEHDLASNIVHAVLARTPNAPAGTKGLSLFVVPKYRVNPDGSLGEFNNVVCSGIEKKMGIHGSPTCVLNFGEGGPCYGYLLGEEMKGMREMFQMMNEARIFVGVQGMSIGAAAYYSALEYAKERVQSRDFRRMKEYDAPPVRIIEHPDVRRMLLTMKAYVEGMRAMCYRAAYWADFAARANSEQEDYRGLLEIITPVIKAYCSDIGFRVCELAIQTKGGYGYIKEYVVERYLRDVKIASLYEGTNGIQALDLIGRKIPKNMGQNLMNLMSQVNDLLERKGDVPALRTEFELLERARDRMVEVNLWLMQTAQQSPELPVLNAVPYLHMLGTLLMGWLHLERAVIANAKLQAILEGAGVSPKGEGYFSFLKENAEARFYDGKVQAARFFLHNLLPELYAYAQAITSQDRSALEVVF